MKVPEPRKLKSGTWFIQMRLGGESVPVSAATRTECIRQAEKIKADYRNGKKPQSASACYAAKCNRTVYPRARKREIAGNDPRLLRDPEQSVSELYGCGYT
jgi:hypothetical protein